MIRHSFIHSFIVRVTDVQRTETFCRYKHHHERNPVNLTAEHWKLSGEIFVEQQQPPAAAPAPGDAADVAAHTEAVVVEEGHDTEVDDATDTRQAVVGGAVADADDEEAVLGIPWYVVVAAKELHPDEDGEMALVHDSPEAVVWVVLVGPYCLDDGDDTKEPHVVSRVVAELGDDSK
jgi:hypothetical protein